MVLTDFLTETRRKWLQAFKLFKRSKNRSSTRNRVSPLVRSPSYNGTVDARPEIDIQRFCPCRTSLPPLHLHQAYENTYSSYNSYESGNESLQSYGNESMNDSAYDSTRSSPAHRPVCYATVTYFNVNDSEDSSSIHTEYTLLDPELDPDHDLDQDLELDGNEQRQNIINESLELVSTL
ncbi:hypothetical protein KGM_210616 [Danaus plexippus plexippus]|uniref:Uncharacterized protein n=1 Tax=Danaus plexippus plexippus TaxID=278856 RepID=A0A212ERU4_DANPL|nr:hypothetical protein KGM_210616 [Danaus plexippus plexippus]